MGKILKIGLLLTLFIYPVSTEALFYSNEKSCSPATNEQNISFRIPHKVVDDQTTNLNLNSNGMSEYAVRIMPENSVFEKDDTIPYTVTSLGLNSGNDKETESVSMFLSFFSEKMKSSFTRWINRGSKYLPMMKKILAENNLPEELVYVPLIESGYNVYALSPANAVGPWQFMEQTARKYNLKINRWVDERRDPVKSTHAASDYLKFLYERYGSWNLALAAYNAGEGRIDKAMKRANTDSFWSLAETNHIAKETKQYVPKFLAAKEIAAEPAKYGFDEFENEAPIDYDVVYINPPAAISFIAEAAGTTVDKILSLNPELKQWCIPPKVSKYKLRIPYGTKDAFLSVYDSTPELQRAMLKPYHITKKQDTLKHIAKRFRVPADVLSDINSYGISERLAKNTTVYLPPTTDIQKYAERETVSVKGKTRFVVSKGRKGSKAIRFAKRSGNKSRSVQLVAMAGKGKTKSAAGKHRETAKVTQKSDNKAKGASNKVKTGSAKHRNVVKVVKNDTAKDKLPSKQPSKQHKSSNRKV
ncbi:MAG: transglycosylase SLT domain-containing protein [Nitrospirae bacterium]|nr:transglycosylase SLT domain-containing protein [Nitrospirota bacterium]